MIGGGSGGGDGGLEAWPGAWRGVSVSARRNVTGGGSILDQESRRSSGRSSLEVRPGHWPGGGRFRRGRARLGKRALGNSRRG